MIQEFPRAGILLGSKLPRSFWCMASCNEMEIWDYHYSLVHISICKDFVRASYVSDTGLHFLEMTITKKIFDDISTLLASNSGDTALGFCSFFSKRENCLTFTEVQVYWCWMLCKPNKYSSEVLIWSFYFSLIWQAAEMVSTLLYGVEKHMACQSPHGWQCSLWAKKKLARVLSVKQIQGSYTLRVIFWPISLDKIDTPICLYVKKKCTIFE